jgi:hypothetical protein
MTSWLASEYLVAVLREHVGKQLEGEGDHPEGIPEQEGEPPSERIVARGFRLRVKLIHGVRTPFFWSGWVGRQSAPTLRQNHARFAPPLRMRCLADGLSGAYRDALNVPAFATTSSDKDNRV